MAPKNLNHYLITTTSTAVNSMAEFSNIFFSTNDLLNIRMDVLRVHENKEHEIKNFQIRLL